MDYKNAQDYLSRSYLSFATVVAIATVKTSSINKFIELMKGNYNEKV